MILLDLYNIDAKYRNAVAYADQQAEELGGEIPDTLWDELKAMSASREELIINAASIAKSCIATAEVYSERAKAIKAKADRCTGLADKIRSELSALLHTKEKYSNDEISVLGTESKKVVEENDIDLAMQYSQYPELIRVKTSYEINKTDAKKLIEGGTNLPFCHIETTRSVRVS